MQRLAEREVGPGSSGDPLADLERLAVPVARALRQPAGANALRAALAAAGAEADLRAAAGTFLTARYAAATDLLVAAQDQGLVASDHDPTRLPRLRRLAATVRVSCRWSA